VSLVITGRGVVSSIGIGNEAFGAAFVKGESGVDNTVAGAGFDFGALFSDRRFRRAAPVTQYALVAAGEALKEAGLDFTSFDGKRVGLVCGVTHGALGYSCEFHEGFSLEGPLGASPVLFSDSVLNAPTGALSLAYAIKGPTQTLIGGPDVGMQAVEYGAELVKEGRVDACLVATAEALHERTVEAYSKLGLGATQDFTEGAGVVVIEARAAALARGAVPVAELAAATVMTSPSLDGSLRGVIEQALKQAELQSSDITSVIKSIDKSGALASVLADILPEAVALPSINELVGEGFCATTLMNVVAASAFVSQGEGLAQTLNSGQAGGGEGNRQLENILLITAGHRKEAGCLILKRS
jgi:3-oxoacyl-[acyl-carrier-protein] synthase II